MIIEFTSNPSDVTPRDGVHMEQGIAITQTLESPGRMPVIRCGVIKVLTVSRETGNPIPDDEVQKRSVCTKLVMCLV